MIPSIALIVLMVSALIMVHELGHFLAAKWAGVRVLKFYLGFDVPIRIGKLRLSGSLLRLRVGETQYGIGWLFFGGYVKMLGQDDLGPAGPTTGAGDYRAVSPPRRLIIVLGGVTMNAIFAFIFMFIALWVGIQFPAPIIGDVTPGGVGWQAGLQPGDRVLEVAGHPTEDFHDLPLEAATLAPGERLPLVVERDGRRFTLSLLPIYDEDAGRNVVHLRQARSRAVDVLEGGPAAQAGMQDRDLVIAWRPGGEAAPYVPYDPLAPGAFGACIDGNPGGLMDLRVQRSGTEFDVTVHLGSRSDALLAGVVIPRQVGTEITAIRGALPGLPSPLGDQLRVGDRVLVVGGIPVATGSQALAALRDRPELLLRPWWDRLSAETYLELLRAFAGLGSPTRQDATARRAFLEATLDQQPWLGHAFASRPLTDRQVLDLALLLERARLGSEALADDAFLELARQAAARRGGELLLDGGPPRVRLTLSAAARADLWPDAWPGEPGLQFGDEPTILAPGLILTELVPGGAAEAAGLPVPFLLTGLEAAGQEPIGRPSWEQLRELVEALEQPTAIVFSGHPIGRDGELGPRQDVEVTPRPTGYLGVISRPTLHEVRATGWAAITTGIRRGIMLFRSVLNQLHALLSGRMSLTNMSGPPGIIQILYLAITDYGLGFFLFIVAVISINLAFVNLLPMPPFDGGLATLVLYEGLRGRPPSDTFLLWYYRLGLLLLLALVVFVFWLDIRRMIPR